MTTQEHHINLIREDWERTLFHDLERYVRNLEQLNEPYLSSLIEEFKEEIQIAEANEQAKNEAYMSHNYGV